jgi:hypothetical protein
MNLSTATRAVQSLASLAAVAAAALMLNACTSGTDASVARSQRQNSAPRVERTGSLINHAVVAHVDDDDDADANASASPSQTGARNMGELLNGNAGSMGSMTNQIK